VAAEHRPAEAGASDTAREEAQQAAGTARARQAAGTHVAKESEERRCMSRAVAETPPDERRPEPRALPAPARNAVKGPKNGHPPLASKDRHAYTALKKNDS